MGLHLIDALVMIATFVAGYAWGYRQGRYDERF